MADKTKAETPATPTDLTQAGTSRKRKAFTKKRGPRVFVKYEVVDGSGNVIPGAVASETRLRFWR
jgi:protocatechuate 3,4-dioxygenase beta subunit